MDWISLYRTLPPNPVPGPLWTLDLRNPLFEFPVSDYHCRPVQTCSLQPRPPPPCWHLVAVEAGQVRSAQADGTHPIGMLSCFVDVAVRFSITVDGIQHVRCQYVQPTTHLGRSVLLNMYSQPPTSAGQYLSICTANHPPRQVSTSQYVQPTTHLGRSVPLNMYSQPPTSAGQYLSICTANHPPRQVSTSQCTLDPAYSEFGYHEQISFHQIHW